LNESANTLNPSTLNLRLLRFFVWGVLAAAITELLELEAAGGRLLVLRRRVIAFFALATLQCDNLTHLLILPDFC
jgi:hypothetical protein